MRHRINKMPSAPGMFDTVLGKLKEEYIRLERTNICSDQLMRSYDASSGIWGNLWWESANMISALADLSAQDASYEPIHYSTFANTYKNAPTSQGNPNFLNEFYDDEGWWGLAWLNIYDLTGDIDYLNQAIVIFGDITGGWTTPCGGGIWWSKDRDYIASISNGMLLFTLCYSEY